MRLSMRTACLVGAHRADFAALNPGLRVFILVKLADMVLRIKLKPELGDQIELGFEEVDVFFLIMHEFLEHIARYVIPNRMAMRGGLFIERPRRHLGSEIAVEHLLDVLADVQRIEHLHVRESRQER